MPKLIHHIFKTTNFCIAMYVIMCVLMQKKLSITDPTVVISILGALFITMQITGIPYLTISLRGFRFIWCMIKNITQSSSYVLHAVNEGKAYVSDIQDIAIPDYKTNTDIAMYAASITMTPGTTVLAVDKKNKIFYVQGLDKSLLSEGIDKDIVKIVQNKK